MRDEGNVTAGELQFYRGGTGALPSGLAYFTSFESMAKFYGPVQEYRLYLRNPKFVTTAEWGGFDSIALGFDPSPVENLRAQGYDSAVWIKETPVGRMYTVVALSGTQATKRSSHRNQGEELKVLRVQPVRQGFKMHRIAKAHARGRVYDPREITKVLVTLSGPREELRSRKASEVALEAAKRVRWDSWRVRLIRGPWIGNRGVPTAVYEVE
jgi:hypothetical protein